jgi:hypothetical protein
VGGLDKPDHIILGADQGHLVSVLGQHVDDIANVDRVEGLYNDCQITGAAVELTHTNLLFSGIALMAAAAIWNKSPRSVG